MSTEKNIQNERLEVKNFIDYFKKSKIQLEMVMVKHSAMMSEECMNAINEEIMHYRNAVSFFEQYLNDSVEIQSGKASTSRTSSDYHSTSSQPRAPFRSDVRDMQEVDVAEDMESEDASGHEAEKNESYKGEERRRNNPNAVRATPIGHERRRRKIRKNSSGLTSLTESKRRFDEMVDSENENANANEDEQRRTRRNPFQSASKMRPEREEEHDDDLENYEQEDLAENEEEDMNVAPPLYDADADVPESDTETDDDIPPVQAEAEEPAEEDSETEIEIAKTEKEEEKGSDESEENEGEGEDKKNNWIKSRFGGRLEAPEMISPLDGKPILADDQDTVPSATTNDTVSGETSQEQKVEATNTTDAPATTSAIGEGNPSAGWQQQENTEPTVQTDPEEKTVTDEATTSTQDEQREEDATDTNVTTATPTPTPTYIPEPEPVVEKKEPFEPVEFNISEEWKFRNKEQRIRINQDVQTVAKMGNLSATDVKVICALAENKQYEFDLIIRNAGEIAEDPNKWIASINKLVRLNLANFLHGDKENQYIFLTENGLWLYGLTQKKNPFTFRRSA